MYRLTKIEIEKAKYSDKNNKRSDGRGQFLMLMPNGSKCWRFQYRFVENGKITLIWNAMPAESHTIKYFGEAYLIFLQPPHRSSRLMVPDTSFSNFHHCFSRCA
jgi:hypothetical protein